MSPSEFAEILGIASIPAMIVSTIVSMQIKKLGRKIDNREKAREERDFLNVKGVLSSICLSKAQAKELRLYGKVNGETETALEYATKMGHEIEDFYYKQGVQNMQ